MKKSFAVFVAAAFVFGSGFLKQNPDGSIGVDATAIDQAKTEALSQEAIAKLKEAAEKIEVKPSELMADLEKPIADIKTKVAAMDPAHIVAHLNQYKSAFSDTQAKVADYAEQVKGLKMMEALGEKGRELKSQLATYTGQLNGLKEQCGVYVSALKNHGLDPATLGLDLSAFGM